MINTPFNSLEARPYLRGGLSYLLAVLIGLPSVSNGQPPAPQRAPQPAAVRTLKVVPLAGSQEMNDLTNKVMAPLVVEVFDQNDQPVEGADVTFRFPLQGPSAIFPDRLTSQTFRTNIDGQAAAVGWIANSEVGAFQVQVTATRGNELGSAVITMTNVTKITRPREEPKHWWSKKWVIAGVAVAVAGVVAGVVLATRGSGSGKVVIATPGSPTLGAPQ